MLKEFQQKCFELWEMFDDICKKNNITYFFAYGSAIGAVREHDFIPWDDDIDIWITRSQYELLRSVLNQQLNPRYKFVEPNDYAPYIFDMIPHLIDTEVSRHKATEEDKIYNNLNDKLTMDFYILDVAPDSKFKQLIHKTRIKFLYCISRSKRYNSKILAGDVKYPLIQRILLKICYLIGKPFSREWHINHYNKVLQKYKNYKSNTLYTGCSPATFIGYFPKECFSDTVKFPFHGSFVPIPNGYDAVLKEVYGDYMTPDKNKAKYIQHTDDMWVNEF